MKFLICLLIIGFTSTCYSQDLPNEIKRFYKNCELISLVRPALKDRHFSNLKAVSSSNLSAITAKASAENLGMISDLDSKMNVLHSDEINLKNLRFYLVQEFVVRGEAIEIKVEAYRFTQQNNILVNMITKDEGFDLEKYKVSLFHNAFPSKVTEYHRWFLKSGHWFKTSENLVLPTLNAWK